MTKEEVWQKSASAQGCNLGKLQSVAVNAFNVDFLDKFTSMTYNTRKRKHFLVIPMHKQNQPVK